MATTSNSGIQTDAPTTAHPRVLLICPKFFAYHERIVAAIEALGFEAIWWADRPSQSTPYKTALRLFAEPVGNLSASHFIKAADAIAPDSLAHVLVIKGEALSPRVMHALRKRFASARFSFYLWDAIENARNGRRIAAQFDAVSTFDPNDSKTMGWHYRPLFSLLPTNAAPQLPIVHDWSFIGTIHSDRADVLARIETAIGTQHSGFVFGYFSSRLLYAVHWLKSAAVRHGPSGRFSLKPMPSAETETVVQHSRITVDIEHPRQSGLTTRCFDAVLAGRKLITTNRFVKETALYHPSRICIVNRYAPVIPEAFLATTVEPLYDTTRYAYSSDSWIRHVLGLALTKDVDGY